jgi:hypothetical protein
MRINHQKIITNATSYFMSQYTKHYLDVKDETKEGVRAHSIWPPCALALGQLTHEYLARLRIDYVASQESVMRS